MRLFGAVTLCGVSLAAAAMADTAGQPPAPISGLTLERAVELAQSRNERAAIAELDVVVADAQVMKARAAFLPVINATGNGNWRPFDSGAKGGGGTTSLDANAKITQPLIVPTAFPLYDEAKHSLVGARAQAVDDKRVLAFDAAHAYLAVLLADGVLRAAETKLVTAKADVTSTTAQFNAQIVSTNDVTRAKIELASAQHEVDTDRGTLEAQYVNLELIINARVTRQILQPTALLTASQVAPPSPQAIVAAAVARRPDLAARRESALAAHDFAREPNLRYLPTLAATGQVNASSSGEPDGHDVDAAFALVLQWNLFDGRARDADAQSRGAQATIADLNADALAREVDAQIYSALAQLAASQAALASAEEAAAEAAKSVQEEQTLYSQQLAKAIELIDASDQKFLADLTLAQAQDSVANAYLALRQAMGLEPIGTELK